jgi:GntR family transcriptional regulator, transcriptional repressor for pyruvate dehydrogenase complex
MTRVMVRRSSLVDDTAEQLRQLIIGGQFQPGDYLPPQRELAGRFGVGASTIHEAIQVLVAVGLLDSRAGKGTWVRTDATEGLIHPQAVRSRLGELKSQTLYDARAVIEVALTEFAAARRTPAQATEIRAAMDRMRASLDDLDTFIAADMDFHMAVARAGHNDLLAQFYALAHTLLEEVGRELISLPRVLGESLDYQEAVCAAIEAGDPVRARRAAERHMHYIKHLLNL